MYICLSDYQTFPSHTNELDILNFSSFIISIRFLKEKKNQARVGFNSDCWGRQMVAKAERVGGRDKNTLGPVEVILPGCRLDGAFVHR